ncbi:MAG: hypothetical protein M3Q32_07625, partial [Pseudomonadota bacterium]|nr:hypothetical protein [Pseudomonadota bacterium]
YQVWQERMREDPLMAWSVEARNRIVKQGDLKLHSILRVSIVASYFEHEVPFLQYEATPKLTSAKILRDVQKAPMPLKVMRHGYLRLERRWVANDLPSHELLGVLSHCWEFLSKLLQDAPGVHEATKDSPLSAEGLPPCMVEDPELRSLWVKLATGEASSLTFEPVVLDPTKKEALLEKYEVRSVKALSSLEDASLRELAQHYFSLAKIVLRKDKYHILLVVLILRNNSIKLLQLQPEDQADKYRLWRQVAVEVKRSRARALIAISEAWNATFDPAHPFRHAVDYPNRREVLHVIAASDAGETLALIAPFERRDGEIVFGEDEETDSGGDINLLAPVQAVWRTKIGR